MSPNRPGVKTVLGLFALATTGLLLWAPPLSWWKDGGQLVSAAWTLGVPHPSGFPVYMMLGKAVSFLPIGSVFFRIQLVSVLCGGMVVALTVRWLLLTFPERIPSRTGALVVAVALLSCPMFVLHGTTPEVYMPTLMLIVASFGSVIAYHRTGKSTSLLWAGASASLALGCHFSVAVVSLLPLAGWALWSIWKRENTLKPALAPLCIGIAGLAAYGYLPLAASNDPWRNWGAPTTFTRLIDHVSAASIRVAFDGTMLETTLSSTLLHWNAHMDAIWESIGPLALVGTAAGVWCSFRAGSGQFSSRILLSIALLDTLYTVWINPMGISDSMGSMQVSARKGRGKRTPMFPPS